MARTGDLHAVLAARRAEKRTAEEDEARLGQWRRPAEAAQTAAKADVAIVFVTQWNGEGFDTGLELGGNQDALVAAVAAANPKTIVVVESGGAVLMPWLDKVPSVVEAWYPASAAARPSPAP
ncbi:MAG: glycoside hydrolase family 3 C-terminal domain-containing protein [Asticcacaulis sp.]